MRFSRFAFRFTVMLALTASAVVAVGGAASPPAKRPNILFCLADDWGYPHASILGDTTVQTPTFDRVAREGVLFRNAHCAAPSCSPSRAAILTGRPVWQLEQGATLLGFLPAKFSVYPDLLAAAGYHVGFAGKGYAPGGLGDRARNPAGPQYKDFAAFLAQRPSGAPFCFWLGSRHPHRPYPWKSGTHDLDKISVPPTLADSAIARQDIADYYAAVETFDREVAGVLAQLEATGEGDNTIVVVTGDNGWPFPGGKATCYDAGTHEPFAIRWPALTSGGRTVDDFTSLADLCPTFLEVAGVSVPVGVSARSLLPVLRSPASGQIDPARDHVLTAMETHVPSRALPDGRLGGYPARSLVTAQFHYLRNFAPDRWPMGDPARDMAALEYAALATKIHAAFADIDAGPAKADLVLRRAEPPVREIYSHDIAHRPARELYDLRADPHELHNLAADPGHAKLVADLDAQLMRELRAAGDPRADGGGDEFDSYTGKAATPSP